tara:strand:- start:404 stop:1696 length:1293 start_codon:yes stop_codon:yes gene_type:complete
MVGLLDPSNAAGYAAEAKRLAVDVPNVTPMDAARFVAEATPIIGDAMAAKQVWDEATSVNPNWALVGALGGATVLGLFPFIGDAAANAVRSGARGLLDTAKRVEVDPNAMGSLLGNVRLKPKVDASPKIKAYHGSPHNFDKFSMDAIGTGQGAQAYGHGLYFGETEDVAKMYRDQLSGGISAASRRTLEAVDGDVDKAILETQKKLDKLLERNADGNFAGAERRFNAQKQIQEDKINQLIAYKDTGSFNEGHLYEVDINASPDDFIDYDAPLSEQTGKVAKYISDYEALTGQPILDVLPDKDLTGKDLYSSIVNKSMKDASSDFYYPSYDQSSPSASDYLSREGIAGVKYLDADSRSAGQGSRNYVVFDEKLINIVKRYGIAGAATMLGVTAMDVEQAMAQGIQQPSGLLALQEMQKRANEKQYTRGLLE